jgi:hypothetical protein
MAPKNVRRNDLLGFKPSSRHTTVNRNSVTAMTMRTLALCALALTFSQASAVRIILDNISAAQNDDNGRFTIERVAAGSHDIRVVPPGGSNGTLRPGQSGGPTQVTLQRPYPN